MNAFCPFDSAWETRLLPDAIMQRLIAQGRGEQSGRIVHFDAPAIETRQSGVYWTATLRDYDGPPAPCGSGMSEAEAVESLVEALA